MKTDISIKRLEFLKRARFAKADRLHGEAITRVLRRASDLQTTGSRSVKAACQTLILDARKGSLDPEDMAGLLAARKKQGRRSLDGLPSVRTLEFWVMRTKRGESLAPRRPLARMVLLPWEVLALQLRRGPPKVTVRKVHQQLEAIWSPAWGDKPPNYDRIAYFFRHPRSRIAAPANR